MPEGPDLCAAEEDHVYLSLETQLRNRYPDWRKTSHFAPNGNKVVMIEFADDQGEFVEGLPGEFVSLVSTAGLEGPEATDE